MEQAIVLSGGGARGAYQAGVLHALEEGGYRPDMLVGTSMGAVNGAAFAVGRVGSDLVPLWRRLRTRDIIRPTFPWSGGFASSAPLRKMLKEHLDLEGLRTATPLAVTALDLAARRSVVWRSPDLRLEHFLASTALVPAFAPVVVDGSPCIDGGLWQNPPLDPALGAESVLLVCHEPVASHAETPPKGVREQAMALSDAVWHIRTRESLHAVRGRRALPKDHPDRVCCKDVQVIAPDRSQVPDLLRFEPDRSRRALEAGYRDGNQWLEGR